MPAPRKPDFMKARKRIPKDAVLLPSRNHKRAPKMPSCPGGKKWHEVTQLYWRDIWHSPESTQWEKHHIFGLYILISLVDQFIDDPSEELAKEIRSWEKEYGLSPDSRRGLNWYVVEEKPITEKLEIETSRPERKNGHDIREILEGLN